MTERLAYRVAEAADALGISRVSMYELIKSGDVPVIVIGKSYRVPAAALREWVEKQVKKSRRG